MGTAQLEETGDIQTRSVGRAVRRPYSDSEDSDNDMLHADDSAVQCSGSTYGRSGRLKR